jgi:hypothetical protein
METPLWDSTLDASSDQKYLNTLLKPIRVCATYKPKLGQGGQNGYSLQEFQKLFRADQFYNWLGLDNPLMYAAHKAAGGMTSIYRQIGIGGESLFRQILQDQLGLDRSDSTWSYEIPGISSKKDRKLSLDGRIPLGKVRDVAARERIHRWIYDMATSLGVEKPIADSLTGTVFEVRQGYKSKDSKRQNADLANAATAYVKTYLPCVLVLSAQIDGDIVQRYRASNWGIVTGVVGLNNPLISTYDFVKDIVGYDLVAFFERNSEVLRKEVDIVLQSLLTAEQ